MGIAAQYADDQALNYYVVIPFTDHEPARETAEEVEALGLAVDMIADGRVAAYEVWVQCGPGEGRDA
jgi:hypothetical protein